MSKKLVIHLKIYFLEYFTKIWNFLQLKYFIMEQLTEGKLCSYVVYDSDFVAAVFMNL